VFTLASSSTNTWMCASVLGGSTGSAFITGGVKSLSGALDRVRITVTTVSTDSLDAGSLTLLYE